MASSAEQRIAHQEPHEVPSDDKIKPVPTSAENAPPSLEARSALLTHATEMRGNELQSLQQELVEFREQAESMTTLGLDNDELMALIAEKEQKVLAVQTEINTATKSLTELGTEKETLDAQESEKVRNVKEFAVLKHALPRVGIHDPNILRKALDTDVIESYVTDNLASLDEYKKRLDDTKKSALNAILAEYATAEADSLQHFSPSLELITQKENIQKKQAALEILHSRLNESQKQVAEAQIADLVAKATQLEDAEKKAYSAANAGTLAAEKNEAVRAFINNNISDSDIERLVVSGAVQSKDLSHTIGAQLDLGTYDYSRNIHKPNFDALMALHLPEEVIAGIVSTLPEEQIITARDLPEALIATTAFLQKRHALLVAGEKKLNTFRDLILELGKKEKEKDRLTDPHQKDRQSKDIKRQATEALHTIGISHLSYDDTVTSLLRKIKDEQPLLRHFEMNSINEAERQMNAPPTAYTEAKKAMDSLNQLLEAQYTRLETMGPQIDAEKETLSADAAATISSAKESIEVILADMREHPELERMEQQLLRISQKIESTKKQVTDSVRNAQQRMAETIRSNSRSDINRLVDTIARTNILDKNQQMAEQRRIDTEVEALNTTIDSAIDYVLPAAIFNPLTEPAYLTEGRKLIDAAKEQHEQKQIRQRAEERKAAEQRRLEQIQQEAAEAETLKKRETAKQETIEICVQYKRELVNAEKALQTTTEQSLQKATAKLQQYTEKKGKLGLFTRTVDVPNLENDAIIKVNSSEINALIARVEPYMNSLIQEAINAAKTVIDTYNAQIEKAIGTLRQSFPDVQIEEMNINKDDYLKRITPAFQRLRTHQ